MERLHLEDVYPLSPLQEGILFHTVMAPEAGDYFRQAVRELRGEIDVAALRRAWQEVLDRHPILRTVFVWEGVEAPVQAVCRGVEVPFAERDWRHLARAEQEAELELFLAADRRRGFELSEAPLMRLTLFRTGPAAHLLVWSFHHLLMDGWSVSLVLQRVLASYLALVRGAPLPPLGSRPYRDYIAWLKGRDLSGAEAFWRRELAGFAAPTPLPLAARAVATRSAAPPPTAGALADRLRALPELGAELTALARRHRLTVNTLVQGAWAVLLARHSGEPEVVFGSTTSGRPTELPGFELMVGLFINTLAVRAPVPAAEPALSWLAGFQEHQVALRDYEHTPLVRVQGWSEVPRGAPLFESLVVFENYRVDEMEEPPEGLPLTVGESRFVDGSSFPLSLIVKPGPPLVLRLSYDRGRFEASAVGRLLGHLASLLAAFVADPARPLGELPLLGPAERQQLLLEWNDRPLSGADGATPRSVHQPFAAQAARCPAAPAVMAGDEVVTYGELARRSGELARRLRCLGVGPEVRVAVCGRRSPALVAGLLAVMEAGGAYVPLDPTNPGERLAFLLADALSEHRGPRVLLADSAVLEELPQEGLRGVRALPLDGSAAEGEPAQSPSAGGSPAAPVDLDPDHPAYVIYTSGSTGRPKGVVVSHRAVIGSTRSRLAAYREPVRAYLLASPFSFDSSVAGIFWTLWQGGALVLPPDDFQQDLPALVPLLARRRVSHLLCLPSLHGLLLSLVEAGAGGGGPGAGEPRSLPDLSLVIVAGEACPPGLVARHGEELPGTALYNEYGPTESTVWCSRYDCRRHRDPSPVPIGRPIPGYRLHLADAAGAPVATGAAGELQVGGPGLARGYLDRPGLTAERFVPDWTGRAPGARLYRTGDLARWRADGDLEFLGRIDHQVKVRGYRIEPGEVEAVLGRHPGVREAVVTVQEEAPEDGPRDRRLVAYLVPAAEPGPSVAELRRFLGEELPPYMVPALFVSLQELPRTPNGKVDRRRLPAPEGSRLDLAGRRVAPRTPAEEALAEIWRQVLRVEEVGVDDNFFELGGDSILALQIVSRAHRAQLRITPRQLFAHPTVAGLAAVVGSGEEIAAEQGRVVGRFPLTPIQRWFFEREQTAPHHYNQALLLTGRPLDPGHLDRAVAHLVAHHDALRLRFTPGSDGEVVQENAESTGGVPFTAVDLSALNDGAAAAAVETICRRVQAGFDLARGPLFRMVHFRRGTGGDGRLLLVAHHLVVDGVSWRILLEDLAAILGRVERGRRVELPAKTTSFKAWAERLAQEARSPRWTAEAESWLALGGGPLARLPPEPSPGSPSPESSQSPSGANLRAAAQTVEVRLDPGETRALLGEAPAAYHGRVDDLLLTALALTLARRVREHGGPAGKAGPRLRFLVELEGHGREEIFPDVDLSRTVGWFTSLYPICLEVDPSAGLGATLKGIKEALRAVPGRGLSYGLLRYLGPEEIRRRLAALPAPEVGFNYLGQADAAFAGDGSGAGEGFTPAPESAGPTSDPGGRRDHLLDVNALVVGGELRMSWTASRELIPPPVLSALAESYRERLRELIAHCREPEAGGYTPSDFPLAGVDQASLDALVGDGRGVEDLHPLAPLQEGMLFHSLLDPGSGEYVEQVSARLVGELDVAAFLAAWRRVLARHPMLRASLHWRDLPRPLARIEGRPELPVVEEDWRELPAREQEERLHLFLEADARLGFELQRAPLLRLALFRLADDAWRLVWSFHHLLLDGQATSQLAGELFELYAAAVTGSPPRLAPARPYREHVAWLARQDEAAAREWWRRTLAGFTQPTPLPADRPEGAAAGMAPRATHLLRLPATEAEALAAFARSRHLTLNTLATGAWGLLLARLAGAREAVFGVTLSGRSPELGEDAAVLGLFINTLPARVRLSEETVDPWLAALQETLTELRHHGFLPLSQLRAVSSVPGDRPLFESILVFESYPVEASMRPDEAELPLTVEEVRVTERTHYPLVAVAVPREGLTLKLTRDRRRFDVTTAGRLLRAWDRLLAAMVATPEAGPEELPLLSPAEAHQLRIEWGGPAAAPAPAPAVPRMVFEQAARTPEAVALVTDDGRLTYGAVVARAEALARRLRVAGVAAERTVGLCAGRSPARVVGLLGILAAGGAFFPLDPEDPPERLALLLADARPRRVVVEAGIPAPPSSPRVLALAADDLTAPAGELPELLPEQLAHLIYTSGSTGWPNGVAVSHGALAAHCRGMIAYLGLGCEDRVLQFAPLSFDPFLEQVLPTLASGGAVVLRGGEVWSAEELWRRIAEEGLTVLNLPTAYWRWGVREGARLPPLPPARQPRRVMPGGDRVVPEDLAAWRRLGLTRTRLLNFYGPTETTVTAVAWPVSRAEDRTAVGAAVPIGRPLGPRRARVVDRRGRPLPVAAVGELVIGGGCLARGYLGRPALTAERFVPDPESARAGARCYRSGDLARWTPDGLLLFAGRSDHQVKVRGFRVEPGEVEAALERLEAVAEAAVVAHRDDHGEARLAAWVVPAPGAAPEVGTLRRALAERLPESMLPSWLGLLPELPRTASGKLDRRALPAPEVARAAGGGPRRPPRSPAEAVLARIWSEVLRVDPVGVEEDFFALGGDSILSLQIVSRARRQGLVLTPRQLFENPTVERLAAVAASAPAVAAEQGAVTGPLPLTPIQRRFFAQELPEPHHFNQSLLLAVASPSPAERPALAGRLGRAVGRLLAHHDALRLRFLRGAEGWRAETAPPGGRLPFAAVDLAAVAAADRRRAVEAVSAAAQRRLDLARGPLLRAVAFDLGTDGVRLLLAVHHLAVDGVSWRLLLEDLALLVHRPEAELPPKTTSFAAWARRLAEHAAGADAGREIDLWVETLAAVAPLPRDVPAGDNRRDSTASLTVRLDAATTGDLLGPAHRAYRTRIDELLLAALGRALAGWTGGEAVTVSLERHGREELFPDVDLSRTVGWLTALHPVRLELPAEASPREVIIGVKEGLRRLPHGGIGYGLLRHLAPAPLRERLSALPEPEVAFNYLGQTDAVVTAGSPFAPAPESAGPSSTRLGRRPQLVEVNARIAGGRFEASWSWSENVHHRDTIAAVADAFVGELRRLVAHCLSPEAGGYSPADFPLARLDATTLERVTAGAGELEDLHPLAPLQEGMLFQSLLRPGSGEYFEQVRATLRGEVDPERFAAAWQAAVDRHPILRSSFVWKGLERPLARVHRRAELPVTVEDWRHLERAERERRLGELQRRDVEAGFDLALAPLLRLTLVRLADDAWHLVWSNHHLLLDGWCVSLLVGEIFERLRAQHRGEEPRMQPVRPFRDFIAWLDRRDSGAAEAFWRRNLSGFDEPLAITEVLLRARPGAGAAVAPRGAVRGRAERRLPPPATARLEAMARHHRLTLNSLVSGAWALLLSRYTGRREVVYGTTVSGRPADLPGAESILGLFINTLPVRAETPAPVALADWLTAFQSRLAELREFEHTPLARIQEWSDAPRGRALFDTLMVFENYPLADSLRERREGELPFTVEAVEGIEKTSFPLTAVAVPRAGLRLQLLFDPARLDAGVVERMAGHWLALLDGMAEAPRRPLAGLPLLTSAERQQLVVEWNDTAAALPPGATIPERFAAQVARRGAAVAVADDGVLLSYAELDRRARRLAGRLRAVGVGREAMVAVRLERSPEMVLAFLAALVAGAAYLPLDSAWPDERLAFMLADARAAVLVVAENGGPRAAPEGLAAGGPTSESDGEPLPRLAVAAAGGEAPALPDRPAAVLPEQLAYAIYTSGSTGRPKGVAVPHAAVLRLVRETDYRQIGAGDRVAQASNSAFDAATFEIWGALLNGACLVGISQQVLLSPKRFAERLVAERVTDLFLTTALFNQLARVVPGAFSSLRYLLFGGERVEPRWVSAVMAAGGPENLLHVYGPTESTTYASWHPVSRRAAELGDLPIGRPIANTTIHLLLRRCEPVPSGVPGELCIGGAGLARGYLHQPRLTAARFVPDGVGGRPGERLYATGDLGRRLPDGGIDFLGRVDHQVKLRGFRIELGEVEVVLEQHPGVRAAVVVLWELSAADRRLAAYVVLERAAAVDGEGLRRFLDERLPAYMVPAAIAILDALPLNANGKVDRGALPPPGMTRGEGVAFVPPRNDLEAMVADLWAEVLHLDRVGIEDDFFLLGGNSLSAMQLFGRLEETFRVELPLRLLFDGATVARLAAALVSREAAPGEMEKIARVARRIRGMTAEERRALLAEKRRLQGVPG